jgi:hypothetical protein
MGSWLYNADGLSRKLSIHIGSTPLTTQHIPLPRSTAHDGELSLDTASKPRRCTRRRLNLVGFVVVVSLNALTWARGASRYHFGSAWLHSSKHVPIQTYGGIKSLIDRMTIFGYL